jgi:diguanylate cyclase (GGDEF)-like protein/PAS domain S-box-containing protein
MPFSLNLKHKLVLLWAGSVLFSLLLVGGIFGLLVTDLHEEQAQEQINTGFHRLHDRLQDHIESLTNSTHSLSGRQDLIAPLNMIYNYQDINNYQPLVFDNEKKRLAQELAELALPQEFSFIGLYDANLNLVSFYLGEDPKPRGVGYLSYRKGNPVVYMTNADTEEYMELPQMPEMLLKDHPTSVTPTATIHTHATAAGLVMEMYSPVIRQRPDNSVQTIGLIKASLILDKKFTKYISESTNMNFTLSLGENIQLGNLDADNLHSASSANPQSLFPELDTVDWIPVQNDTYFIGSLAFGLEHGQTAAFSFGVPKNKLSGELSLFRQAMMLVLGLAALTFVPIGLLILRHIIFNPIGGLMNRIEAVRNGSYDELRPTSRMDELGFVANSFNTMANAIRDRERELEKLSSAVEHSPASVIITDPDGTIEYVNPKFIEVSGYSAEEAIGKNPRFIKSGRTSMEVYEDMWQTIIRGDDWQGVILNRKKNGDLFWESISISSVKSPTGEILHYIGIKEDITSRHLAEEEIRRFKMALDTSADCIFLIDPETMRFVDFNQTALNDMGYSREELLVMGPQDLKPEFTRAKLQAYFHSIIESNSRQGALTTVHEKKSGDQFPVDIRLSALQRQQGDWLIIALARDITERKRAEEQIAYQAYYDTLTDLPNRRLLYDRLEREVARSRRRGHKGAVLFLDLDNFKIVNDSLGHQVGDDILRHVANCLSQNLREEDTAARLGGDEFVVLLSEISDDVDEAMSETQAVAQKILQSIETPCHSGGHVLHTTCSIGITIFPVNGDNADDFLKQADIAMYRAKDRGRNTYQFYMPSMQVAASERLSTEQDLRLAIPQDQLSLHYQPQVLADGTIIGAECLLRWQHPKLGMVPPDHFIPIAEDSGLIIEIGNWVLHSACNQLAQWQSMDSDSLKRLAVNISPKQFKHPQFVEQIKQVIQETGVDANGLELEVTEGMLISNLDETVEKMNTLRDLGITFSIDDFGTGYSSLSYLKRLPVSVLKIDRSFVRDITTDPSNATIVDTIIAMAMHLGLEVVAEGVETEAELAFLRSKGCGIYQGYYFSRPLPIGEFNNLQQTSLCPNTDSSP